MIELTHINGQPIWLRPLSISSIRPATCYPNADMSNPVEGTSICMLNGHYWEVQGSPRDVLAKMVADDWNFTPLPSWR